MNKGMKWNLTATQWKAMETIIGIFVQIISETPNRIPSVLMRLELMLRVYEKLKTQSYRAKAYPNKDLVFKLSYIEGLCFYETVSKLEKFMQTQEDTLHFAVCTELCRDIHQKLIA